MKELTLLIHDSREFPSFQSLIYNHSGRGLQEIYGEIGQRNLDWVHHGEGAFFAEPCPCRIAIV